MTQPWLTQLKCAMNCVRCDRKLGPTDPRILSVYDHEAICITCKQEEEGRSDYEEISRNVTELCLLDAESGTTDPHGYCYHHFYPYTCAPED